DRGLLRRQLPGQIPVRLRHLGIGRRQRRPRRGARGRTGLPRRAALRPLRVEPLAYLRLSPQSRLESAEVAGEERVPPPDPGGPSRKPPREAIAEARVRAPAKRNPKLQSFLDAVNEDEQVRAWWYMAQVHAERLGMSDHSWVHTQIV